MSVAYIRLIKDMYEGVQTSVRTLEGDTYAFLIDIGCCQVLTLSSFIFIIIMNELTKGIQDEVP